MITLKVRCFGGGFSEQAGLGLRLQFFGQTGPVSRLPTRQVKVVGSRLHLYRSGLSLNSRREDHIMFN